jgi:hypothetical protein
MALPFEVQKSVKKIKVSEQTSDFAYWQTQPYEVRLATLEQIRQEYHRWKYGTEPGLPRVYTIQRARQFSDQKGYLRSGDENPDRNHRNSQSSQTLPG